MASAGVAVTRAYYMVDPVCAVIPAISKDPSRAENGRRIWDLTVPAAFSFCQSGGATDVDSPPVATAGANRPAPRDRADGGAIHVAAGRPQSAALKDHKAVDALVGDTAQDLLAWHEPQALASGDDLTGFADEARRADDGAAAVASDDGQGVPNAGDALPDTGGLAAPAATPTGGGAQAPLSEGSTSALDPPPLAVDASDIAASAPEPSEWLLMVGGFAVLGSALRRRRAARLA